MHEAVAAEFTRKFAAAMGSLSVGRGTAPTTQVGPLIDAGARADVHALVTAAVDAGATALTGGVLRTAPATSTRPPSWRTFPRMQRSSARRFLMQIFTDIRVKQPAEIDEKLEAAVRAAQRDARTKGSDGVLVIRYSFEHYSVALSPDVPFGQTY